MLFKKSKKIKELQEHLDKFEYSKELEFRDLQARNAAYLEKLEDFKARYLTSNDFLDRSKQEIEQLRLDKEHLVKQARDMSAKLSILEKRYSEGEKKFQGKEKLLKEQLKSKEDIYQQDKQLIQSLQEQVEQLYADQKDMIAKNERLSAQIKAMNVCIMEKKDAVGRAFSRIAPLIDAEGYDQLCQKKGRMKLKLTHADGKKQVVFVELGDK